MPTLTAKQALDRLSWLFPTGLKDPGLLAAVCPEGWEKSPLRLAFHPTAEQRYREHLSWLRSPIHEVIRKRKGNSKAPPTPSFEDFLASEKEGDRSPSWLKPEDEWLELLGSCLWDILSNNHKLLTPTGKAIDLGSFRAVSGLIDEFIEGGPLSDDWDLGDCTRFYMGTSMISSRTDLSPVHLLIFRRIKQLGYDWKYYFPRIHLIRFHNESSDPMNYDSSEAFAETEEFRKQDEDERKQRDAMARDLAAAKNRALDKPPPGTVRAYQEVFGKDPPGCPPDPHSPD